MEASVTWFGWGLVLATCTTLVRVEAMAQGEPAGATLGEPSTASVTLEGFVLGPDGSPAEGAVVVSSAGGRAVTDVAGSYRLQVEVPLEASSVQITAVGSTGGNLVASASVALSAATPWTHVDPLQLALGALCSPSWIPTFGEQPGTNDSVRAIAVYDDGGGPALYLGGDFTTAGGVSAIHIAKWDGSSWSALGSGMNGSVSSLTVYDDGGGTALYAGGRFTLAGGLAVNHIARWDGSSWSALGSGMDPFVNALVALEDGAGAALLAGGPFLSAFDSGDSYVAKWGHAVDLEPPALSCPSAVLALDGLGSAPGEIVTFSVTANDCQDPSPVVVCVPPSGSFFSRGTTLVTCTATDAAANQSTCQFPVTVELKARRR